MNEILMNDRICPKPQQWNHVWEIIKSKTEEKISMPLILAAWWGTSDSEKMERFEYHLDVAKKLNVLTEVKLYLHSMNENDWHHKGE